MNKRYISIRKLFVKRVLKENEKIHFNTWLLGIYLFSSPLDFMPILEGVSVSRGMILLPLLGLVLNVKNIRIRFDKYLLLPILYLATIMISYLYSFSPDDTLEHLIVIGMNIFVILMLSMINYNYREIDFLKKAIVLSGWLTLVLALLFAETDNGGRFSIVINGIRQDPNYLSGFLFFAILYYLKKIVEDKKLIDLLKVSLFLTLVLLTGSRGGLVAMLVSMITLIIIWLMQLKLKPTIIIKVIFYIFASGVFLYFIISALPTEITERYSIAFAVNDGGANRFIIWKHAIDSYKNFSFFHKVLGAGSGTIIYYTYNGYVAHNVWIETLVELGIFGTGMLFLLYYTFIIKAYRMKESIIVATFIGYFVMMLTLSIYSYKPIWNILLLILIIKNSKNNNR